MKFHDNNFDLAQDEIYNGIVNHADDHKSSFKAAAAHFAAELHDYHVNQLFSANHNEWAELIKNEIHEGFPIAISKINESKSVHDRTVLGYDGNANYFLLYNLGTTLIYKSDCLLCMNTRAGCETFSFEDSEKAYSRESGCTDLLKIKLK